MCDYLWAGAYGWKPGSGLERRGVPVLCRKRHNSGDCGTDRNGKFVLCIRGHNERSGYDRLAVHESIAGA